MNLALDVDARDVWRRRARWLLGGYLTVYVVAASQLTPWFPAYAWPSGDEATYVSQALHPWTLRSELLAGYPPKELANPFNLRGFLNPISLALAPGFSVAGPRCVIVAYGLLLLLAVFLLVRRLAGSLAALVATIVFSLTPAFVYFSHVVRPEGLFAAGLIALVGLVIAPPGRRRDMLLGILAAGLVWIHYNGVIGVPLAMTLVLAYEGRAAAGPRCLRVLVGAALLAGAYLLLNFWPARPFLAEYGPWPQTFVSHSGLPVTAGLASHVGRVVELYKGLLTGTWEFERSTGWLTLAIAAGAVLLALWRGRRETRIVVLALTLVVLAQGVVVPNAKSEYLFYVYPLVFVAAATTCAALSGPARIATLVAALVAGSLYATASVQMIAPWFQLREPNRATAAQLAEIVAQAGSPESTKVLGPPAFFAATYGARYRTFQALAVLERFDKLLAYHKPDVVILTRGALASMAELLPHEQSSARSLDALHQECARALSAAGFHQTGGGLAWNGEPVEVYVRVATEGHGATAN